MVIGVLAVLEFAIAAFLAASSRRKCPRHYGDFLAFELCKLAPIVRLVGAKVFFWPWTLEGLHPLDTSKRRLPLRRPNVLSLVQLLINVGTAASFEFTVFDFINPGAGRGFWLWRNLTLRFRNETDADESKQN